MKSKKIIISSILTCLFLAACTRGGGGGGSKADPTKTSFEIYSFNGGVGNAWLQNAINEFSRLHADESFEEGKTGVEHHQCFYGRECASRRAG